MPGLAPLPWQVSHASMRRDADLGLGAARRLLQRDLEVVAQVGAAVDAVAARRRAAAEDLAEDVAEGVGEAAEALGPAPRARRAEARRRIDAGMAELVVGGALLGVGEDLVGFLRLLEFLLGALLSGLRSGWYFIASLR